MSRHLLHKCATQERVRIEAVGATVGTGFKLPAVNWEGRVPLLTLAIRKILDSTQFAYDVYIIYTHRVPS